MNYDFILFEEGVQIVIRIESEVLTKTNKGVFMEPSNKLLGAGRENMPNIAFRMMAMSFSLIDLFHSPAKLLDEIGIKKGFTVIDYGCGPGRYIKKASQLVGENGKVIAVDIHKLAVESVKKRADKENLKNVTAVLANGYSCDIEPNSADLIYALDMFHMIEQPEQLLRELHRLTKADGVLIIDDGHQPRDKAKAKVIDSKVWNIIEESKRFLKCSPI